MLTASSIDRWQAILFAYNLMDVYICAIIFRIILNLNVNTATSFQIKNWQIIDNISIHRRRKNNAHVSCVDSWFFSWFFVKFSRLEYTFRHQNGKVLTIVRMTTAATSIDFFVVSFEEFVWCQESHWFVHFELYIHTLFDVLLLACLLASIRYTFVFDRAGWMQLKRRTTRYSIKLWEPEHLLINRSKQRCRKQ